MMASTSPIKDRQHSMEKIRAAILRPEGPAAVGAPPPFLQNVKKTGKKGSLSCPEGYSGLRLEATEKTKPVV